MFFIAFFLLFSLLFTLILYLFLRHFLVIATVENQSMSPTLKDGEKILALRHYPTRWLRKGLIVLIQGKETRLGPLSPVTNLYIKRIVGLGGEKLVLDANGDTDTAYPPSAGMVEHTPLQIGSIPMGYVYVLGDNRMGSIDSRSWGPIPAKNVVGVAMMKLPSKQI